MVEPVRQPGNCSKPPIPSRLGFASPPKRLDGVPAPSHAPPTKTSVGDKLRPGNWRNYWDQRLDIHISGRGTFRVHTSGQEGPVLLCIHGGGYASQTWSLLAAKLKNQAVRIFALDLRGHGETKCPDSSDLSRDTLVQDIIALWAAGPWASDAVPVVLVGHSLGGALVVHAATGIPSAAGVVVVDVVEGTAMASLPHMMSVINSRPSGFPTLNAAIQWALRTGMCHNPEAACISVPSMLDMVISMGAPLSSLMPPGSASPRRGRSASPAPLPSLAEDEEGDGGSSTDGNSPTAASACSSRRTSFDRRGRPGLPPPAPQAPPSATGKGQWMWRTPLRESFQYWEGWFSGLSQAFLDLKVPKMLLLAGADRLDKTLMIGQMQGKFQLVLLPQAGHAVHEDEAERTAEVLQEFVARFRIGQTLEAVPAPAAGVQPVLPLAAGPAVSPA